MPLISRALVAASLALCLYGCGDSTGLEDCSGTVELTATDGPVPEFDWEPCGLNTLVVSDGSGQPMWGVHSPINQNILFPPLTYGQLPAGLVDGAGAVPLRPDEGYVVRVFRVRLDRQGESQLILAGETSFRY